MEVGRIFQVRHISHDTGIKKNKKSIVRASVIQITFISFVVICSSLFTFKICLDCKHFSPNLNF